MLSQKVVYANPQGMHLRPATTLAGMMCDFPCGVRIVMGERDVDAKSPISLVGLEVACGTELEVRCDGEREDEALAVAVEYLENNTD